MTVLMYFSKLRTVVNVSKPHSNNGKKKQEIKTCTSKKHEVPARAGQWDY